MAVTEDETKESGKYIRERTILLYEREGGLYKPRGSGVLMEFLDIYFIITASHVIIDDKPLYFYLQGFGMQEIDEFYREAIDFKIKENHNQDVGFIILNPVSTIAISLTHTFEEPRTNLMIHDMSHNDTISQLYQIVGYPEKINDPVKLDDIVERQSAFILTSKPIRNPDKVYKYYNLNPIAHYILESKGTSIPMQGENAMKLPPLNGMSGGGIWMMGSYEGKAMPILIGIFTEIRTGKYHSLIGCKINIPLKRIIALEQAGIFGTPIDLSKSSPRE